MKKIVIELFPVEKSCPQGCPPCPLHKIPGKPTASVIDEDVNASFQLLEEILSEQGKSYAFYFLGPGDSRSLLPTIAHPELVDEVALAINKVHSGTDPKALTERFLAETQTFISSNFDPRPKKLRVSIVPEQLFVQEKEYEILRLLIKGFQGIYGTTWKEGLALLFEVRSNLVPHRDLLANTEAIKAGDRMYIERLMSEERGPMENKGFISSDYSVNTYDDVMMYYSKHHMQLDGQMPIDITNRVLTKFGGLEPITKNYRTEATHELHLRKVHGGDAAFAIAPRGVMFFHASLRINNPIFWMSHEDFQNTLRARRSESDFRIVDFGQQVLLENTSMSHYQVDGKDAEFTFAEWLELFAYGREYIDRKKLQEVMVET